jgi:hypothetical protein
MIYKQTGQAPIRMKEGPVLSDERAENARPTLQSRPKSV